MSKVLIVHADDFNLTPGVNQGIVQGFSDGTVRSTSIMANRPGLSQAVTGLPQGLDLGLHFNLTMGRPLSPAKSVPSLVREDGQFHQRKALPEQPLAAVDIATELVAQLDAVGATGVKLSHIDTHHHIHEDERVFASLLKVARQRGLAVRCYGPDMYRILQAEGVRSPQHLIVRFYDDGVTMENLKFILGMLPQGVSELCCHPAVVDDELRGISSYTEPRAKELELLCSPDIKSCIAAEGIRLAGYADAF
ncbi:MAG TPA: ChbG/HpnK family deacetylase [Candidatus Xenobia bacterium]|jgi:hypothetical protein